jgi:hypothetical protein
MDTDAIFLCVGLHSNLVLGWLRLASWPSPSKLAGADARPFGGWPS